jgi:hypothetical protein
MDHYISPRLASSTNSRSLPQLELQRHAAYCQRMKSVIRRTSLQLCVGNWCATVPTGSLQTGYHFGRFAMRKMHIRPKAVTRGGLDKDWVVLQTSSRQIASLSAGGSLSLLFNALKFTRPDESPILEVLPSSSGGLCRS